MNASMKAWADIGLAMSISMASSRFIEEGWRMDAIVSGWPLLALVL